MFSWFCRRNQHKPEGSWFPGSRTLIAMACSKCSIHEHFMPWALFTSCKLIRENLSGITAESNCQDSRHMVVMTGMHVFNESTKPFTGLLCRYYLTSGVFTFGLMYHHNSILVNSFAVQRIPFNVLWVDIDVLMSAVSEYEGQVDSCNVSVSNTCHLVWHRISLHFRLQYDHQVWL